LFVIAIVRAIVLFVIATWFIWAGITAAIIAVVWMQLHQAHKDPLLVQVGFTRFALRKSEAARVTVEIAGAAA